MICHNDGRQCNETEKSFLHRCLIFYSLLSLAFWRLLPAYEFLQYLRFSLSIEIGAYELLIRAFELFELYLSICLHSLASLFVQTCATQYNEHAVFSELYPFKDARDRKILHTEFLKFSILFKLYLVEN